MKPILFVLACILLVPNIPSSQSKSKQLDPKPHFTHTAKLQNNEVFIEAIIFSGHSSIQQLQLSNGEKLIEILKIDGAINHCKTSVNPIQLDDFKARAIEVSRKRSVKSTEIRVPKMRDLENECGRFKATSRETQDDYDYSTDETPSPSKDRQNQQSSHMREVKKYGITLDGPGISEIQPLFKSKGENDNVKIHEYKSEITGNYAKYTSTVYTTTPTITEKSNRIPTDLTKFNTGFNTETSKALGSNTGNINSFKSDTSIGNTISFSKFVSEILGYNSSTNLFMSTAERLSTAVYTASRIPEIPNFSTRSSVKTTRQDTKNAVNYVTNDNSIKDQYRTKKRSIHGFSEKGYKNLKRENLRGLHGKSLVEVNYQRNDVMAEEIPNQDPKKAVKPSHQPFAVQSRRRRFIYPGTKWCGAGNVSWGEQSLGVHAELDRCCEKHDKCDATIELMTYKYSYFNFGLYTISHCECDSSFRTCLRFANTRESNEIGDIFFNKLSMKCFILRPEQTCAERKWTGTCAKFVTKYVAEARKNSPYTIV